MVFEPLDDAADTTEAAFLAGMTLFIHANASWTALTDPGFRATMGTITSLDPAHLYNSHAPAVHGHVDIVVEHMHMVSDRPGWLPDADDIPAALAAHDTLTDSRSGHGISGSRS
ncbi:MAG: hypothetical protein ACRDTE_08345 [Pseudonocardiaceae bacterium]